MKSISAKSLLVSFLVLMGFWYIMSGYFDLTHSLMGVLSVGIVLSINYRLKKHAFFDDETDVIQDIRFLYIPVYFVWLISRIFASGFNVARILLSPSLPIQTSMVKFKVDFPNTHCKMILGNSITLTPGTLTVDIQGDEFIVHSISPQSFEGLANDNMPLKVLRLFTTESHPVVSDFTVINSKEELK